MRTSFLVEPAIVISLVLVVIGLFTFTYFNYIDVRESTWESSTKRVMDSMQPFQAKYHQQHGRYAVGIYDRLRSVIELNEVVGWKPSITDQNRYIAHIVGKNAYKVVATSPDGDTICRIYPAQEACFKLETYHQRGF